MTTPTPPAPKTDDELLTIFDNAWNSLEYGAPDRECDRAAIRAVYDAGRTEQRPRYSIDETDGNGR